MKKILILALSFLMLTNSGCLLPTPCDSEQMASKSIRFSNTKLLAGKIQLDEISIESSCSDSRIEETELKKALATTLMSGKVYSANVGRYLLSVELVEESEPDTYAFDNTNLPFSATLSARYLLRTRERGILVFKKELHSSGTATKTDAYWGENRLRIAKERAAKANLENFFNALNQEFGGKPNNTREKR